MQGRQWHRAFFRLWCTKCRLRCRVTRSRNISAFLMKSAVQVYTTVVENFFTMHQNQPVTQKKNSLSDKKRVIYNDAEKWCRARDVCTSGVQNIFLFMTCIFPLFRFWDGSCFFLHYRTTRRFLTYTGLRSVRLFFNSCIVLNLFRVCAETSVRIQWCFLIRVTLQLWNLFPPESTIRRPGRTITKRCTLQQPIAVTTRVIRPPITIL